MLVRILFVVIASLIGFLFGFGSDNVIRYTLLMAIISGGTVLFEYYIKRYSKESVTNIFKGFVAGLLLGAGINAILKSFGITLTPFIRILVYVVMVYIGVSLISQLEFGFGFIPRATPKGLPIESPKILDTSVIIDGRIADIIDTKFIEGVLVVPKFVLDELQQIADSADSVKRSRGRRGLDVLNRLKRHRETLLRITDQDFPEIHDVDSKLVKLAKTIEGKIITNDFNLHKVAELQGVPVLNINQLANALKPIVLPGEKLKIVVIKEGKDPGQGIGYLDDGTMVVVDSGKKYVGEEITVNVTSVLQTPAGRMIFAKYENE